jgi:hypothetical protein
MLMAFSFGNSLWCICEFQKQIVDVNLNFSPKKVLQPFIFLVALDVPERAKSECIKDYGDKERERERERENLQCEEMSGSSLSWKETRVKNKTKKKTFLFGPGNSNKDSLTPAKIESQEEERESKEDSGTKSGVFFPLFSHKLQGKER